jgi:hypothetical protein
MYHMKRKEATKELTNMLVRATTTLIDTKFVVARIQQAKQRWNPEAINQTRTSTYYSYTDTWRRSRLRLVKQSKKSLSRCICFGAAAPMEEPRTDTPGKSGKLFP